MKKTLAAVAVLGAFAGSALAADVTLYGRIDTGLQYTNDQVDVNGQEVTDDSSFGMGSGLSTGSRIGIKGTEQISDDLKVSFVLENGFSSDSGKDGDKENKRAFNREASLSLTSDTWGTISMGRVGAIVSDIGTYGFYAGAVNPFGTGWSGIGGQGIGGGNVFATNDTRYDNTLTYKSPTFAGTTLYAQYSFKSDDVKSTEDENTHRVDRYAALGANFTTGNLTLAAVVDWVDEACVGKAEPEDKYTINFGGNYDFGVMKLYGAAQYFKGANSVGGMNAAWFGDAALSEKDPLAKATFDEVKGYGVALGADIPAWGGNFLVSLAYSDSEDDAKDATAEFTAYQASVAYKYPLSKRTVLYSGVGYTNREADKVLDAYKVEEDRYDVTFGMVHYF